MTAKRQKPRRTVAWLAILALLIQALVPASLAAAAALQGPRNASGWCGTGPGGHEPDSGSPPPVCNHCILCAVSTGFAPTAATGVAAPAPISILIGSGIAEAALPRPLLYHQAQPRGPPVAARI